MEAAADVEDANHMLSRIYEKIDTILGEVNVEEITFRVLKSHLIESKFDAQLIDNNKDAIKEYLFSRIAASLPSAGHEGDELSQGESINHKDEHDSDEEFRQLHEEVGHSVAVVKKPSARKSGFNTLMQLHPNLAEFLGATRLARTEVVKKMWEYIRANNLQDPKDKRVILCDEKMMTLFGGKKKFNMFKMNKYLAEMISSAGDLTASSLREDEASAKGEEAEDKELADGVQDGEPVRKKSRRGGGSAVSGKRSGGVNTHMLLSNELTEFLGVSTLSLKEVTKRIWKYVDAHRCRVEGRRRVIVCDKRLKKLFGADEVLIKDLPVLLSTMVRNAKHTPQDSFALVEDSGDEEEEEEGTKEKPTVVNDQLTAAEASLQRILSANGLVYVHPVQVTPELAVLMDLGDGAEGGDSRVVGGGEVFPRVWEYVGRHGLRDTEDSRFVICDDLMRKAFKTTRSKISITSLMRRVDELTVGLEDVEQRRRDIERYTVNRVRVRPKLR